MIIFLVILVTLAMGVGLALLLRRQIVLSPMARISLGALGLVGGLVAVYGAASIRSDLEPTQWPSAAGTVVESRVEGERAFHSVVVYEYAVGGVIYRDTAGLRQPSFGGRSKRREVALRTIAGYAPGRPVTVDYDPADPSRSTLERTVFWADYGMTGAGAFVFGAGLALPLLAARRRPR